VSSWFQERGIISNWLSWANDSLAVRPTLVPMTIANGESLSTVGVVPKGKRVLGLITPATWTDSSISLQISFNNSDFFEVTDGSSGDAAALAAITGVKGGYSFCIPVWTLFRAPYLKVRSGTLVSPTAQGADRVLNAICVNCNAADH
jgi:hypothetical protein